jgi:hypothetical protein
VRSFIRPMAKKSLYLSLQAGNRNPAACLSQIVTKYLFGWRAAKGNIN